MSRSALETVLLMKDNLAKILPSTYILIVGDDSGNPTLTINQDATPAAGEENAVIRIIQESFASFPTVSLASNTDGRPSILQLIVEESATTGISVWNTLRFSQIIAECSRQHINVDYFLSANGVLPATTGIAYSTGISAGTYKGTIASNPRWANIGK